MNTVEILKAARAKIEKPENWTQFGLARNATGSKVQSRHPEACSWCAAGAIESVAVGGAVIAAVEHIEDIIMTALGIWNDSHTHAEVLALFDKAISAESAK